MSKQLRFFGLRRGSGDVRKIDMDAGTAASVSAMFLEMKDALLPEGVQKKKYRPLAASAEDDAESVFAANFELPKRLHDLAEKGDVPGPLKEKDVLAGNVRAIIALSQTTRDPVYLFQAVPRRNIIRSGWALFMSNDTFRERMEPALIIGDRIHAVWQSGELLFRKESDARKVVDFSSVFQPATDKQLVSFAEHEKVSCSAKWLKNEASDYYRRRIAAILASGILETYSVEQFQSAARTVKFKLPLKKDEDGVQRISFDDDKKKLRQVLQFLNEDVYSAPITQEIYCAAGKTGFEG